MKKFSLTLLLVIHWLSVACSSDGEVLATFTGGKITRKEMKEFYKSKDAPINAKTTSLKNQLAVIENIALQKIAMLENKKNKVLTGKEFTNVLQIAEKQLLANLYRRKIQEDFGKSKKIAMAMVQFLYIRKTKENDVAAPMRKHKAALDALTEDRAIFSYISENTDEKGRRPIGGLLEPFCTNCGSHPMYNIFKEGIVSKDKKKFYISTDPAGNGYLYRLRELKQLPLADLNDYIKQKFTKFQSQAAAFEKDAKTKEEKEYAKYYIESGAKLENKARQTADHYKKVFNSQLWTAHRTELLKKQKVEINEQIKNNIASLSTEQLKPETVLYSKNGQKFTYQQLNQEFDKLRMEGDAEPDSPRMIREKLAFLYNIYLPGIIFAELDVGQQIQKSQKYALAKQSLKREISWSFYQRSISFKDIEVSEQEIRDTYEAGKMYSYLDPEKKKQNQNIPLPFARVKERIRQELQQQKTRKAFSDHIANLKKNYQLKILNKKLKEGEL